MLSPVLGWLTMSTWISHQFVVYMVGMGAVIRASQRVTVIAVIT